MAAAVSHVMLNFKGLINHLKTRAVAITGVSLTAILVLLYGVVINNAIPPEMAAQLDALANSAELQAEGKR